MASYIHFWNEGLRTFHPICLVSLVLVKTLPGNSDGIQPIFLKIDLWSLGSGFIHITITNVLN